MEPQSVSSILQPQVSESTSTKKETLGKEDFLKMLTAQMKYQNPLEPMNDAEFIGQMTQFSSLEQLQNMNDLLSQNTQWNMLLSQTINNTMATSLIGKTITADASVTTVGDQTVSPITFSTGVFALNGTITIYNEAGEVVRTLSVSQLGPGEHSIAWNGRDANGNELATGNYGFRVDLRDAKGQSVPASSFTRGVVEGVEYVDGQAFLLIDGGMIPLALVRHVAGG